MGRRKETCWEMADRHIRKYHQGMERARLGGTANEAVCRDINRWLEYRARHSAQDLRKEL